MKNFLFLPFLLFLLQQSQEQPSLRYRVTYELQYQVDSTNVNSKRTEEMHLYVGQGVSRFSSYGRLVKDTLKIDKTNSTQIDMARLLAKMPRTDFNYTIFKGIPSGNISYTERIGRDDLLYTEERQPMKWQLTAEVDTIAGFPVQKATTRFRGRRYQAWYTPEIPIPDGPYKFSGLPGLILQIEDEKGHYKFTFTGMKELNTPLPLNFVEEKYIETDRKKFLELKQQFKKDPITVLQNVGIDIRFSPEQKRKADRQLREKLKRENNPIELTE